MGKTFAFSLTLSCLVAACVTAQQRPAPTAMTAQDALAAVDPVINCERAATARYDDRCRALNVRNALVDMVH